MVKKHSVLFVCIHNAGRSQMAASYLKHFAGDAVEVRSAGSAPANSLNPKVIEVMMEEGIDLTNQKPKLLTADSVQSSDFVITMGCGDACPFYPGKKFLDWKVNDPAGESIENIRIIRDEIRCFVKEFINTLQSSS